jgi:hypothetical protein
MLKQAVPDKGLAKVNVLLVHVVWLTGMVAVLEGVVLSSA